MNTFHVEMKKTEDRKSVTLVIEAQYMCTTKLCGLIFLSGSNEVRSLPPGTWLDAYLKKEEE